MHTDESGTSLICVLFWPFHSSVEAAPVETCMTVTCNAVFKNKTCYAVFICLSNRIVVGKKNKMKQVGNKNQMFIKYIFKITSESDRSV